MSPNASSMNNATIKDGQSRLEANASSQRPPFLRTYCCGQDGHILVARFCSTLQPPHTFPEAAFQALEPRSQAMYPVIKNTRLDWARPFNTPYFSTHGIVIHNELYGSRPEPSPPAFSAFNLRLSCKFFSCWLAGTTSSGRFTKFIFSSVLHRSHPLRRQRKDRFA